MGIALVCIYALLLIYTAGRTLHKGSQAAFFINNRASSSVGVGFSIIVSCVGASATIGVVGMAFKLGTPAFWWLGSGALGLSFLTVFLSARVRKTGAFTMPELAEKLLGKAARPIISVIIVSAWMAILAAQFVAISTVLQSLTGLSSRPCLLFGFILIVLHSFGGQASIMRTDKIQAIIILLALLITLAWLNSANSGWLETVRIEATNAAFTPSRLAYYAIIVGANYLVCPMLFGRFLSAKDVQSAQRGGVIAIIGLIICSVIIVSIGLACSGLIPADTAQDNVLNQAITIVMPKWLFWVMNIALLSAIVTSADSCLITAATVLGNDLLKTKSLRANRTYIFILGAVGMLLSLGGKDILGFLFMAYDIYACGVVMPVFIAIVASDSKVVQPVFACTAIICGGILGVCTAVSGQEVFSYAGMAISTLICLAGLRPLGTNAGTAASPCSAADGVGSQAQRATTPKNAA